MAQNIQTLPGTKQKFSEYLKGVNVRNLINNTLSDPQRAARFVASISAAVASAPSEPGRNSIRDCDPATILTAALVGESLNLSPSPQIGHYYLVPFRDGKTGVLKATFVLGYKGYLQLAMRSGVYRRINVLPLKQGELKSWNPLEEEAKVVLVEDDRIRDELPTTHYYAEFEYLNGFRKALCWSRDKMEQHAMRYSRGYAAKKGYTFWEKDFDGMGMKTMLRQLIGKWGLMSTEMQTAFERDDTYATALEAVPSIAIDATEGDAEDESAPASEPAAQLPAAEERPSIEIEAEPDKAAATAEHGGGNQPPRPAAPIRNGNLF